LQLASITFRKNKSINFIKSPFLALIMSTLPITPGTYYIQNVKTGTVIDLLDGGAAKGTPVNGWYTSTFHPFLPDLTRMKKNRASSLDGTNKHQIWTIADVGHGTVVIINVGTGTYLTAPTGS
jgi:hypothetical protein